jgi:hypothetical protein
MEIIKQQLDMITSNPIRRRLEREFVNLVSLDLIYPETVMVELCENKMSHYPSFLVSFVKIKGHMYFEFIVNINYPFTPPKLNINFRPYLHYLNFKSSHFKEMLFTYKKIRCFCCKTILCGDNWVPSLTLKNILEETEHFKNICRDISHIIIINVIKRKYLIDDININDWLF